MAAMECLLYCFMMLEIYLIDMVNFALQITVYGVLEKFVLTIRCTFFHYNQNSYTDIQYSRFICLLQSV